MTQNIFLDSTTAAKNDQAVGLLRSGKAQEELDEDLVLCVVSF